MKKLKMLFLSIVLMIVGVVRVDALTKSDLDYMESDFVSLFYSSFMYDDETNTSNFVSFKEGENPNIYFIQEFVFGDFSWDRDYIVNKEYYDKLINNEEIENHENIIYQIPAEEFEDRISKRFNVTNDIYSKIREDYSIGFAELSEYKEIDGKYYYYSENMHGLGFGTDIDIFVKGYKNLENNIYQMYYYMTIREENLNEKIAADAVLGKDYIIRKTYDYETDTYVDSKFLINDIYTTKVEYKGGIIKYLSFENVKYENLPKDEELVLYEDLENFYDFKEGSKQEFDISKDKGLTFKIDADFELFHKVYVDGKEIEKSNYTAKSGSTIITFNDEYTKKLSAGRHTLKVTFTDGEFAQTTFTIKQNIKNPDTGIDLGYGAMLLLIIMGSIAYILVRKQSKFAKHN